MPANLRTLGRTDIRVSPVAMGCWAIVGDSTWGTQDETDAINALKAAHDCGINHFDTAEGYGAGYSEELVGKALRDVRDQIVIASKVSPNHAGTWDDLQKACDASLRYLQTDVIDVYYLHWPNRDVPTDEIIANFARLRDAGKIRAFAVSNFGKGDLTDLLTCGRPEVNQLPYNLLFRAIEDEILPVCRQHEISVNAYSPIAQGLLTGKFSSPDAVPEGRARTRHFASTRPQARHTEAGCEAETFAAISAVADIAAELGRPMAEVALAWLLQKPGIASVLVGIRNPEQARANAQAMQIELTPDTLARLAAATSQVKARLGPNPDMWQTNSRYR